MTQALSRLRLAVLALILLAGAALAQTLEVYSPGDGFLNLREGPSSKTPILREMYNGQTVQVLDRRGNWRKVRHQSGTVGWAFARYLRPPAVATEVREVFSPNDGFLNLREGPSGRATIIRQMYHGEQVTILGAQGKWRRVRHPSGAVGWAFSDYLVTPKTAAPQPERSAGIGASTLEVYSPGDGFLNLREGPSTRFRVIREMYNGQQVAVLARSGAWLQVRHESGAEGWAYSQYLVVPIRREGPATGPRGCEMWSEASGQANWCASFEEPETVEAPDAVAGVDPEPEVEPEPEPTVATELYEEAPRINGAPNGLCSIAGREVAIGGMPLGRFEQAEIIGAGGFDLGRRDGPFIVRVSDGRDACKQDGQFVVNVASGQDIGTGDAGAICLCAGLLY